MISFRADDTLLDDPAGRWWVGDGSSFPTTASRRASTLELAGIDGVTVARGGFAPAAVTVELVITDVDAMGVARGVDQLHANRAEVCAAVGRAERLWMQTLAHGWVSSQITSVALATPEWLGADGQSVTASISVQPFWGEAAPTATDWVNIPAPSGSTEPVAVVFPELAGVDNLSDAVVRVQCPASMAYVTCATAQSVAVAIPNTMTGVSPLPTSAGMLEIDVAALRARYLPTGASDWTDITDKLTLPGLKPFNPVDGGEIYIFGGKTVQAQIEGTRQWLL